MKKFLPIILSIILIFSSLSTAFSEETPYISSEAGILIDYDSGKILYSKNADQKMYPASTTKVMTALLTLERTNLSDKVVIDYDLGYIDGNSMSIKKGEVFTVEELLRVVLVRSANDACVVLANYISGSTEEFAKLMNQRAKELGAKNTHFNNPNGLPDPNHYTSAYDLSLIAKEAMKYEKFREIVKTPSIELPPTPQTPEGRSFKNSNRFLWGTGGSNTMEYKGQIVNIKYDLVDGIKTGFTSVARQCLISSGQKNGFRLISVVLKSEGKDVYRDSRSLLEYGFENYSLKNVIKKDQIMGNKIIPFSKEKEVKYAPTRDFNILLKNNEKIKGLNIDKKIILNKNLNSSIKKGDIIGKVELYQYNEIISKVNLMALNDITPILVKYPNINKLIKIGFILLKILLGIIFLLIVIKFTRPKKRKKRIFKRA